MPSSVLTADDARYQELTVARLKDEVAVGGNTIRVWGGGVSQTLSVSTDIYVERESALRIIIRLHQ